MTDSREPTRDGRGAGSDRPHLGPDDQAHPGTDRQVVPPLTPYRPAYPDGSRYTRTTSPSQGEPSPDPSATWAAAGSGAHLQHERSRGLGDQVPDEHAPDDAPYDATYDGEDDAAYDGPEDDHLGGEDLGAYADDDVDGADDGAHDEGYDEAHDEAAEDGFHEEFDDGPAISSWNSRKQLAAHRRTVRRRRLRGAVVLVLALAVVAGAGAVAFDRIRPLLSFSSESGDFPGPGTGSVTIQVADGDTATAIGATLAKAGVVKTAKAFSQAAAADPKGTSIQPGGYTLKTQMKASEALAVLVDPANRSVPRVTIREGLWKSETFAALAKASGLPVSDYVAAAKDAAALGLPAAAKGNVEGWLFPATYEFPEGSTAAEQLQAMVAKTTEQLTSLGVASADTERIITIASIVQAEGRRAEDLPKIARVVDNRLAVPMRLQLDSTVSYGVQKRALTTTDAERAADNGYNTYVRDGLPAGPISNPGAAAIQAAQQPADGPWIYFVAVNPETGETKFAVTDAEHAVNVTEFQQWCSDHPGKC